MSCRIFLVLLSASLIAVSLQDCTNEEGLTRCTILSEANGSPLVFEKYQPRVEISNYTGNLYKGIFSRLARVEQLVLTSCVIGTIEEGVFCHLPNLKYLHIIDCKMPAIDVSTFGNCLPSLKKLSIQKAELKEVQSNSFQHMAKLEYVQIEQNLLTTVRKDTFKGLNSLEYLYLKGNKINTIEEGAFNGLSNLKLLNLNDNLLADAPIGELNRLTSLEDLYLSNNTITEFDLADLLQHLKKLKFFSFYLNQLKCDQVNEINSRLQERRIGRQVFQMDCFMAE